MDCSVLPRPMSSHRIPCSLYLFKKDNQFTPSCKTRQRPALKIPAHTNLLTETDIKITALSILTAVGFRVTFSPESVKGDLLRTWQHCAARQ